MKKVYFIFFSVCLFSAFSLLAQNDMSKRLSEDLNYFRSELPKQHKNLFSKISEKEFYDKVTSIESKITLLNDETFANELFKLIVSIGDEHTRIKPPFKKTILIEFEKFSDGIFVIGIDSIHQSYLLTKLVAINNIPIDTVIKYFKEVIKSDNNSYFEVGLLKNLNNPSFLKGMGISTNDSEINYTISNIKKATITLNAVPIEKINSHSLIHFIDDTTIKQSTKYWFSITNKTHILYFNYLSCEDDENLPFTEFNNDLFKIIDEKKPNKIIVDLRYNDGGNSDILTPFIEKIKGSYLNRKGKLYVLIGRKTFSSALMNAIDFKRNTNAILVGQPTSGNINHYGEVRGFKLPNTKIIVGYSTKYFENWKGMNGPLLPDISVNYSVSNYKLNIDEAIKIITKK